MSDVPICLWTNQGWPQPTNTFDSLWDQFTAAAGRSAKLIMCYTPSNGPTGGGSPMSQWVSYMQGLFGLYQSSARVSGNIPVLGFGLGSGSGDGNQCAQFAAGQWDSMINGIVAAAKTKGFGELWLRIGWEMNGDWYPWSVTPSNAATFVAAFQHVASVARSAGSSNGVRIKIIWNPNSGCDQPMLSFWPGAGSVDIVALDQYSSPTDVNWKNVSPLANAPSWVTGQVAPSPNGITYQQIIALAKANNLPIAFGECGGTDVDFANQCVQASLNAAAQGVSTAYIGIFSAPSWWDGSLPAVASAWFAGFGANGSVTVSPIQPTQPQQPVSSPQPAPPTTGFPPVSTTTSLPYTPSPNGTIVGPGGIIVDNNGNVFGITAAGQVAYNGRVIAVTHAVDQLLKAMDGSVWQRGSKLYWEFGPVDANGVPTTATPMGQVASPLPATHALVAFQISNAMAALTSAASMTGSLTP